MHITIAVCTHRRPDALKNLLRSVDLAKRPENLLLDLIVVWNDHHDAAFDATQQILDRMMIDSKLLIERSIGLSYARNMALANVTGDYVYFVDDDVVLTKDTFVELSNYLSHSQPDIFGTRVILHNESDIDITTTTLSSFESMSKDTNPLGFIHGCSLIISKKTIEKMGNFDTILGAGAKLRSGEDLDYIVRTFYSGLGVNFVPTITVRHDHERNDPNALKLLLDSYAVGAGATVMKHIMAGQFYLLKWHVIDLANALRNGIRNRSLANLNTWFFRRFIYAGYGSFLYVVLRITQKSKQIFN